ncbi:MAG: LPS export ABC transporter permease LptG [Pseudomonadota bacterium]
MLDRYLAWTFLKFFLVVASIILALDVLFAFIDELEKKEVGYSFIQIFIFVCLTIPSRLYEFLPVSSLIGAMVGLGLLATQSELIVLRAAGLSIYRILLPIGVVAILIGLLGVLLAEFVIPKTAPIAQNYRAIHVGDGEFLQLRQGNWQKSGEEFIFFKAVDQQGALHNLFIFNLFEDGKLQQITQANRAIYNNKQWSLYQVEKTRILGDSVESEQAPIMLWTSDLTPQTLMRGVLAPEYFSITQLFSHIAYLKQQGVYFKSFELAFWKKALQPLATIVMVILASSLAFGSLRQSSIGLRVTLGVIFGLTFQYFQDMFGSMASVFNISIIFASVFPMLLFFVIGSYQLKRAS